MKNRKEHEQDRLIERRVKKVLRKVPVLLPELGEEAPEHLHVSLLQTNAPKSLDEPGPGSATVWGRAGEPTAECPGPVSAA
jgi:hypothetical protein